MKAPRPNIRRKPILEECLDAMNGVLEIKHRLGGCADPNCRVCPDNHSRLDALTMAIERVKQEIAK